MDLNISFIDVSIDTRFRDRNSENFEHAELVYRNYTIYNIFVNYLMELIIIHAPRYTSLSVFQVFSTLKH